jgi:putative NIF3 family GTP cyclohydrolase 1 type 2
VRAREILSFWESRRLDLAPHEGFRFGAQDAELTGILVCWLPTLPAIRRALAQGCNLIVAAGPFRFPPSYSGARLEQHLSDRVTLQRLRELDRAQISLFRAQESLAEILEESLAGALGLPEPQIGGDPPRRIYHVSPLPARQMAEHVRQQLDVEELRVCGDLVRVVRRVGLLWGNRGSAHNPNGLEPLLSLEPDLLIAGDADEYPMRASIDAGVPMVLIGHARSLAPGLRRFAAMLRGQFPGLRVEQFENPRPWVVL